MRMQGLVAGAAADLAALQRAGVDAVMFGNENDRPYEFDVDRASTATMAYVIGQLRSQITMPFGVNVLWDPQSTVALAAATGADFVQEIFTGTYASDMGVWAPDAGVVDIALQRSVQVGVLTDLSYVQLVGQGGPVSISAFRCAIPTRPWRCAI